MLCSITLSQVCPPKGKPKQPRKGKNITWDFVHSSRFGLENLLLLSSQASTLPTQRRFSNRLFLCTLCDIVRGMVQREQIPLRKCGLLAWSNRSISSLTREQVQTRDVNLSVFEPCPWPFSFIPSPRPFSLWYCVPGILALGYVPSPKGV